MGKNISRRSFLRGTAASILGVTVSSMAGGLASAEESGKYTPGVYSATAQGISTVSVTMSFDANSITDVQIDVSGETEGIGKGLGDSFAEQILAAQSAEIDAVSGATVTSTAIKQAAEACIAQAQHDSVQILIDAPAEKTWRDAPDPIPDSEIAETIEVDVAVVGLGYAGLTTTRAAAEAGTSVLAIEAMPEESWWTVGHDVGHFNSKLLESFGVPKIDPVEFMNNWMLQTHNKANPALVMKFAKNCGEACDWFFDAVDPDIISKVHITHWPENESTIRQLNNGLRYYPGTAQWWENQWNNVGAMNNNTPGELEVKDLSRGNYDYIRANCPSAQFMFETRGVQLVKDGDAVVGVIAMKADGSYVKVMAKKGVVLSGGGFGGNPEMCNDLLPHLARNFTEGETFMAPFGRDGSTIAMGVWAGGRLEGEISTMNFDSMSLPDSVPGALWVDEQGRRFQNEGFAGTEINGFFTARGRRGNTTAIYDSTYPSQIVRGYPGHSAFDYGNPDAIDALIGRFEAARTAGAAGADGYYCAETIEELAQYIGADVDVFKATVEQYNKLCAEGVDTDFGKDPRFLNPIAEGPFFAHVTTPSLGFALVTTGGFVTTNDQQVLDAAYRPIPGLFACGNTCGMRFGPAYITPIPGVSIGMCITLGRELGKYLSSI